MSEEKYFDQFTEGLSEDEKARFYEKAGKRANQALSNLSSEVKQETQNRRQAELREQYNEELDQARQGSGNYALLKVRIAKKYRKKGLNV